MLTGVQTLFRPSAEKRRILLIEDEFVNQAILKAYTSKSIFGRIVSVGFMFLYP